MIRNRLRRHSDFNGRRCEMNRRFADKAQILPVRVAATRSGHIGPFKI